MSVQGDWGRPRRESRTSVVSKGRKFRGDKGRCAKSRVWLFQILLQDVPTFTRRRNKLSYR